MWQIGPRQIGPRQIGPRQIGPRQIGPRQIGPRQIGPPADWAPENFGCGKLGPRKLVGGKLGPGKLGPGRLGTSPSPLPTPCMAKDNNLVKHYNVFTTMKKVFLCQLYVAKRSSELYKICIRMEGLPVWKPYSNADTIWALLYVPVTVYLFNII